MTLEQVLKRWKKGSHLEAKLSPERESSLIVYPDGEFVLSYGVSVDDILGKNWEVEECGL